MPFLTYPVLHSKAVAEKKQNGPEWRDIYRRRPSDHWGFHCFDQFVNRFDRQGNDPHLRYEFVREKMMQSGRRVLRARNGLKKFMLSIVNDLTHPLSKKSPGSIYIDDEVIRSQIIFNAPILTVHRRRMLRQFEFEDDTQYDSEKEDDVIDAFKNAPLWNPEEGDIFNSRRFRSDFIDDIWDEDQEDYIKSNNSDDDDDSFMSKRKSPNILKCPIFW